MRTIEDILLEWIGEFGVLARGKNGPYRYIKYSEKKDLLIVLVGTLIDEGYDSDTLKSVRVANLIINACEAPDGASSRTASKINKSKKITATDWKFVLTEFFRGPFSTGIVKEQNTVPTSKEETDFEKPKKVAKALELNPTDRIKMDTSNMAEIPLDLEFLSELGLDESFINGTPKDE